MGIFKNLFVLKVKLVNLIDFVQDIYNCTFFPFVVVVLSPPLPRFWLVGCCVVLCWCLFFLLIFIVQVTHDKFIGCYVYIGKKERKLFRGFL